MLLKSWKRRDAGRVGEAVRECSRRSLHSGFGSKSQEARALWLHRPHWGQLARLVRPPDCLWKLKPEGSDQSRHRTTTVPLGSLAPWVTEYNVQKMKEKVLARNVQRFVKTLILTLCWNSYC